MIDQFVEALRSMPPLPKRHYSWPLQRSVLMDPANAQLLREYARVTGALTIWGEGTPKEALLYALAICKETGAALAFAFNAWIRKFPEDAPATYRGPQWLEEIKYLQDRLSELKSWLGGDAAYVKAIIINCERFFVDPKTPSLNPAIYALHQTFADLCEHHFPDARREWYNMIPGNIFVSADHGEGYSVPLYDCSRLDYERKLFQAAAQSAAGDGKRTVTPWVAMGAEYRWFDPPVNGKVKKWDNANLYDSKFAFQLGAMINRPEFFHPEIFAPYKVAEVAVLYPQPFAPEVPDHNWGKCFLAYCCGANGREMLVFE